MRQRIIVNDSQSMDPITIDDVEASVWSELEGILSENGISSEGMTVFQGDCKDPFTHGHEPVLQSPVLYVYIYPAEMHSGATII